MWFNVGIATILLVVSIVCAIDPCPYKPHKAGIVSRIYKRIFGNYPIQYELHDPPLLNPLSGVECNTSIKSIDLFYWIFCIAFPLLLERTSFCCFKESI